MLRLNLFSELPNLAIQKSEWKSIERKRDAEEKQLIARPSAVPRPKCLLSVGAVSVDVRFLNIHLREGKENWQGFEVIGSVVVEEGEKAQKGLKLAILLEIADISSNVCSALPIPLPLWVGFAVDVSRIFVAVHTDIRANCQDGKARNLFEVGADVLFGSVGAEIGGALGVGIGALIKAAFCTVFACSFGPVGALVTSVAGAAIGSIVGSAVVGTIGKKIIRRTMGKNGRDFEELGKEVREEDEEEVDELGEEVVDEAEEAAAKRRQFGPISKVIKRTIGRWRRIVKRYLSPKSTSNG